MTLVSNSIPEISTNTGSVWFPPFNSIFKSWIWINIWFIITNCIITVDHHGFWIWIWFESIRGTRHPQIVVTIT